MNKKTFFCINRSFVILFVMVIAFFNNACNKDDDQSDDQPKKFTEIALADIKAMEADLSATSLVISNTAGALFKAGDILFYKTNLGNYGKMEIITVDPAENYKMTFKAVTYNSSGNIIVQTSSLSIQGTWLCNLDEMTEGDDNGLADFWNERINATDTQFTPKNGAIFVKYKY